MILLQSHSRFLLQTLLNRVQNLEKAVELDYLWVEFNDVRYHILVSMKNPNVLLLSVSLPTPPPEAVFISGLPLGAVEAIKAAYGVAVQILDPPRDGFNLTLKLNLAKLPPNEGSTSSYPKMLGAVWNSRSEKLYDHLVKAYQPLTFSLAFIPSTSFFIIYFLCYKGSGIGTRAGSGKHRYALLVKIASVREVVLGAPLRVVLKHLVSRTIVPAADQVLALVHRPKESFFLVSQPDKVTVVFPMRFKDSIDTAFATSFLQEFVEARHTAGLNNAPPCLWSPTPPLELKEAPAEALSANAGFVSFVIFPRHVEGKKLDRTVWNLSTFHAYVSYHVKCSEGFMHTRMRRRVESLIQALDRAKPGGEEKKKSPSSRSFKRLTVAMSRAKSLEITAQICKRTGNIKVCLQVLLSRPQALFRYDLMAMAENAIQLSRKESNDTVDFFNNLASSKDTNPALKLVLKSCVSNFKEGFMFLNLSGLEGRTATFDMHNAYDNAIACETDLSANKVATDLVAARIKKWKDVFSVAMATAGVLEDSLPIPE
ncbi:hypothetical protein SADUNF_Sadunf01G0053800 [Salix dunnii]|uniref:Pectinesterase inhibitor domain-containing protein n=1 Tax=Salix dunnii TaxID=1413687 RepID=A0A835TM87_9ROSI|nr:hypothetical protein SADUNF_Sadunf01G0053800 [Salix dunnii]